VVAERAFGSERNSRSAARQAPCSSVEIQGFPEAYIAAAREAF
jgi:hypothetical protein